MKFRYFLLFSILVSMLVISGCIEKIPVENNRNENVTEIFDRHSHVPNFIFPGFQHFTSSATAHPKAPDFHPTVEKFIDEYLAKSETASQHLEMDISRLKEEGKDTAEIERLLEEYRQLIGNARTYKKLADEAETDSDREKNLHGAASSIFMANEVLKQIFNEYLSFVPQHEKLDGTGKISVEGSGRVVLSGALNINMFVSDGLIYLTDYGGNTKVVIEGNYSLEIIPDRWNSVSYTVENAGVDISSPGMLMVVSATNVSLTADGHGEVAFFGNGTFYQDLADMKDVNSGVRRS